MDDIQPNIIVILADDLGYRDVGYMGGTLTPTPFIDALAENGVWFTSGYSTCPVCAPGRAGLLTGRYQNRFGFEDNPGPYRRSEHTVPGIPLDEKRMTGIQCYAVVGILPTLGHNHPGMKLLAVEFQMIGHQQGITDLLDHDDIRPE